MDVKKDIVVGKHGGKKCDRNKLDWTILPHDSIEGSVQVMMDGAKKYGRDNWKKVEIERYLSATYRHLLEVIEKLDSINEGEFEDVEGNLGIDYYNVDHLVVNTMFLQHLIRKKYGKPPRRDVK